MLVAQKREEWSLLLVELEQNGGLQSMTTSEVNKLVSLITVGQRAGLSTKLLGMMKDCEVAPNTLTYDLMMLAHAAVGNPEEVKALFSDMKEREKPPSTLLLHPITNNPSRRPQTNRLHLRPPPQSLLPPIRRPIRHPRNPRNALPQHPPQPRHLHNPDPNLHQTQQARNSLADLQPHQAEIHRHRPRRRNIHTHDPRLRHQG